MNTDPKKSALPCGCDEGCDNYKCERHRTEPQTQNDAKFRAADEPYITAHAAGVVTTISPAFSADPVIGIGGAPTRATILPTDAKERKQYPMATGLLDYFPDALAYVSYISWKGNEQHNPGQPLHWARGKSTDEADTCMRHFSQRGTLDTDGTRHTGKAAWRILAILQKELEADKAA